MNDRSARAAAIKEHGSIHAAVSAGALPQFCDLSLSEAIVLGLLNQGVTKYVGIFGHGSTDIAEVLRVYEDAGLVRTFNVRHETEASHAATALKLLTGETAAVITSIGPGALHAFAGSLAAASNGAGVYHIYGDETTHDEGFNMQQVPRSEQALFLKLCSAMGQAYSLYDPWSVFTALRRGAVQTAAAGYGGPFFLLVPMNKQPEILCGCNCLEFPAAVKRHEVSCADEPILDAIDAVKAAGRITIKIGNGARGCGKEIMELADLVDAAVVSGPSSAGIVPYSFPRYMTVGGSKGSISGNFAMNEADCVVIIGARAVCQWDCSGTAWKNARCIINFNTDPHHGSHYNRSIVVPGDAKSNLRRWLELLKHNGIDRGKERSSWMKELTEKKKEWEKFKKERYDCPPLTDPAWGTSVLTQPASIKAVCDFADAAGAVKIFDAGDVQANGFQIVQDEREGQTLTDTGASFMGFSSSAILASAMAKDLPYLVSLCGDGSFMMNPQVLIDAVEHGARGCVVIFDNRRMAAISGLQQAQYGMTYRTSDSVAVDYVQMANAVKGVIGIFAGYTMEGLRSALASARSHAGLSVVHVPVYSGDDEKGGMGVFGDWNVGNWCGKVQEEHHRIGL